MNKQIKEEKNCFLRDYSLQKEVEKLDLSEKIRAQLNLANIRILLEEIDIVVFIKCLWPFWMGKWNIRMKRIN